MKDLQKDYTKVDGLDDGDLWEGEYFRKEISKKDKILVVATANVAVEAVIVCVIQHWPGAQVLKIGGASRDPKLHEYCLETKCHKITNWFELDDETQKKHIDIFITKTRISFSQRARPVKR